MNTVLHSGVIRNNTVAVLSDPDSERRRAMGESKGPVITSDEPLNLFLHALQADHISQNTLRAYDSDINRFITFIRERGHTGLADIQSSDLELFFRQLMMGDSSASAIRRNKAALRKFFRFLFGNGTIAANPFDNPSLMESFTDRLNLPALLNIIIYCRRHYEAESTGEALRYRRDELMLLFMILHGIRQYHIPALKLSAMSREGDIVMLKVSDSLSLKVEGIVLQKLYLYLKSRSSKADVIFVEPATGKPVTARSIHALMIELSYAVRVQVNPQTLHHTFLHLQRHPDDASRLLRDITRLEEEQP